MSEFPCARVFWPAAVALALLAGCAHQPTLQPAAAERPAAQPNSAREAKRPEPPKQPLSEQVLYQLLLAEVAMQRGETVLATHAYLDLIDRTRDYRVAERGAQVALNARLPDQALVIAQKWLELEPESVTARQTLAGVYVSKGQLDAAKPHLQKILAAEGSNIGFGFLHLNNLLARHADKAAVLALVRELASDYPHLPEAHYAVARAAWGAGNRALAVEEARAALALRPDWEGAALFKAQVLNSESAAQAAAFYRAYLQDFPKAREMRLAYARLLVQERQYAAAKEEFTRLVADFPNNAEVPLAIGLISFQLNEYDSAEAYLKRALDMGVKDENAVRLYLGQVAEQRGRWEEAREWYLAVRGAQAFNAQLRVGGLYARQGDLAAARRHLQQITPANNQQRAQLISAEAQLLRDAKDYPGAFEVLSRGLEKLPNHPDLLYDHAMAAEKVDRLDALEASLKKLIQLKPDHAHAYNALGYTLADRTTRLDEAKQYLDQALKLAPDDPFILDSMGWLQYRLKNYDQALAYLRRALSLRADPEIAAHLGEVLWVTGNHAEAQQVWDSALKAHPGHESVTGTILRLQSK